MKFQVHAEKMQAALTMDVLATDLADYLVRKGVSIILRTRLNIGTIITEPRLLLFRSHSVKPITFLDGRSPWLSLASVS